MPHTAPAQLIYLNGQFITRDKAVISVMDRGFLFGDGVYEVIPAYSQRLFRLKEHIERLNHSLKAVRIKNPYTDQQWQEIIDKLIQNNEGSNQSIYLQITRGSDTIREHLCSETIEPTVFIMSNSIKQPSFADMEKGISVTTVTDIRWHRCDIKAITLLPNILMKMQAHDDGANEAILIRNGLATEGAASNLFIVQNDTLITPPKSSMLLPGITRDLIIELAKQHHITSIEENIKEDQLFQADEIWLSSSTKEIRPIISINKTPVGQGKTGELWYKMIKHYQEYKAKLGGLSASIQTYPLVE
ncbi:MAG: D-amino acid aminotransferase [Methylococcales bacterium]|jgi:D-alanine transaminase|nr:D-amino acid aminotransferase [Methylococcales bacterium]MBT7411219.1 D-amino acid aminotransferase [Methylococcales bacterium]